jgi:hypothetical protein
MTTLGRTLEIVSGGKSVVSDSIDHYAGLDCQRPTQCSSRGAIGSPRWRLIRDNAGEAG